MTFPPYDPITAAKLALLYLTKVVMTSALKARPAVLAALADADNELPMALRQTLAGVLSPGRCR